MFQFTDDCLIGIKELDDEHRRLFSLINQAMDILNHTDSNDRCTQITHLLEELTPILHMRRLTWSRSAIRS